MIVNVARKIITNLVLAPSSDDAKIIERSEEVKALLDKYAPSWDIKFFLLSSAYNLVLYAVIKFFSDKKFLILAEAFEEVASRYIEGGSGEVD